MRIGIDASNIREGGGLTHLEWILRAVDLDSHGIDQITVWGSRTTLDRLSGRPGIRLVPLPSTDRLPIRQVIWQSASLRRLATSVADLLFVPGGTYLGSFRPFVTMSRSLLPFDPRQRKAYGFSGRRLRYVWLEAVQSATLRRADGVIFLTNTARRVVESRIGGIVTPSIIIPHGISEAFRRPPRPQHPITSYSLAQPFSWLYVSTVNTYKNQWRVAEAVAGLRRKGLPVALDLVGSSYPPALRQLKLVMRSVDPTGQFIRYHGSVPHEALASFYGRAHGVVIASSCETFGQVLLEAMASGLPIACSNRSALPETLREAGELFDPEDSADIARALELLVRNMAIRERCARLAYERAQGYTWERCAQSTFAFLTSVGQGDARSSGLSVA